MKIIDDVKNLLRKKINDSLMEIAGPPYDLAQINDEWIMMLTAMVKDCGHMIECPNVNRKRREMALPFRQERKRRKLARMSVYDDIEKRPVVFDLTKPKDPQPLPRGFNFANMPDDHVQIWYAIGAEIGDFSMLGQGVRKYVYAIYNGAIEEIRKRNLKAEFFCDLRM